MPDSAAGDAASAEDLRDLALVLARSIDDSARRTHFDEVLAVFGHTRQSLADVADDVR
ncbi:hypothetical protein [Amycolatopsis magusensis]|uniref:hypothetical protein n=1 Tax=Amycolatopsis magusensis TaxID=882444 RepID=UPI0037AD973C